MKKFIKNDVIKSRAEIVLKRERTIKDKNGNEKVVKTQVYNPTEAMILADGWIEYVEPQPTEEQLLAEALMNKQREISDYDQSPAVNEFYVGDIPMWLDKATRAGLLLRFNAEKAQGLITTTLWSDGRQYPLNVDEAIAMLFAIELYASACYDNTQRHLAAVNALTTVEEIEQYDYTEGYPSKLRF